MPYMEFDGEVKKMVTKPTGEKEIVLIVQREQLRGKLDSLDDILAGGKASITLDSLVVNYNITINAQTNKPIKEYKVDDKGIVSEVKPEGEQLEANLGLPAAKIPTKEEQEQAEREVIDEFILSGMAPSYDELPYDFANIVKRRLEGETYMKLASELEMSSGKIVELVDEYRKRVAPLAAKWWEWKQGQEQPESEGEVQEPESDEEPDTAGQDEDKTDAVGEEQVEDSGTTEQVPSDEEIEEYILGGKAPVFPDIEFDFPNLLDKKKKRGSWTKIATEMNLPLGKMQRQWREYKQRIAREMRGGDTA
ncbi:hypothetical protein DFP93_102141 [Aneurinibacillus soli]|uniref:Uncharacterized protein n=1 Tax=Aneurinibacillus soli TaxID=1500254 RepID=A0A0U4WFU8_9BACL|nr:2-methylcitrate dehydratase [Aneurinibacillus soli]PYE63457.1 hypothetical protein DFP93_102141 [Aneurinibacillus soli]BAU27611.1 hypothetical protein CB4_01785 [Aneurinibacillus soli]